MVDQAHTYLPDQVSPPGSTLLDILEDRGMSQKEIARRMGRPLKTVNEIIKGKTAITSETALQLERVLAVPAHFWNQREANYREYVTRIAEQQRIDSYIPWLDELPLSEMRKYNILPKIRDRHHLVQEALTFFGIVSPEQWREVYARPQIAFRRSVHACSNTGAVATWIRLGELGARDIKCAPYDKGKFQAALLEIRALTTESPDVFTPHLIELCANSGVAVAFVTAIRSARVSGITRWLTPHKALIQLSLYGKYNDRLWFTFFHEAAHILKHNKSYIFIEGDQLENIPEEEEADCYAADLLIPHEEAQYLSSLRGEASIRSFAIKLGIHPGIVVGRMQHDDILPMSHLNRLKDRFEFVMD